jgi:DNA-binding transcriptional MocR family regulator
MLSPIEAVTAKLREAITTGAYVVGDRLPTLEEVSQKWIGSGGVGSQQARAVYAPLIADGLVEARTGRAGGHYVIATTPMDATATDDELARLARAARDAMDALVASTLYVVEFQKISNGHFFGACLQPSRGAAERFAVQILTELGEDEVNARSAAEVASWGCADTSADGYGVRIYPRQVKGKAAA